MSSRAFSRRNLITGAPLITGVGLAGMAGLGSSPASAAMPAKEANELLADPAIRARVRARVIGSCGEEMSYKFFRLNVFGYMGDGNLLPFFTMNHLSAGRWSPMAGDQYRSTLWECGYYCRFDTDEALDVWKNPVTGELLDVFHFLGGPFEVTIGADGVVTEGAEVEPQLMRMEAIADQLMVPTIAGVARPNPVDRQKYPQSWSGAMTYFESQATFSAKVGDAFNENLTAAPAFCHFQNLRSWHPSLRMGDRPGRTYGNARGAKLRELSEIPGHIMADFRKYTPEIFDLDSWKEPRQEVTEYLATQKPAS